MILALSIGYKEENAFTRHFHQGDSVRKPFAYLAIAVGVLALLVAAAAVILPLLVNPNQYKGFLADMVRQQTGRELTFDGDLSLSVFPWLGVEVGPTRLSNAPAFGAGEFLRFQKADVKVRLLPLLRKKLVVKTVALESLSLTLIRNAEGKGNWEDLIGSGEPPVKESSVKDANTGDAAPSELSLPLLRAVDIRDAQIVFEDRTTGARHAITGLFLKTGALALDDPDTFTDVSARFRMDSDDPKLTASLNLVSKANLLQESQTLTLQIASLQVKAQGDPLPGGQAEATLSGGLTLDLRKGAATLKGMSLVAEAPAPQLPDGKAQATLKGDVNYDPAQATVSVSGLTLSAFQANLAGQFSISGLGASPQYTGGFQLTNAPPRTILAALGLQPPATRDETALSSMSADITVEGTTSRLRMPKAYLVLDQTVLDGTLTVADFSKPDVSFKFAADTLDADRYLPQTSAVGTTPEQSSGRTAKDNDDSMDDQTRDSLRRLRLDGSIHANHLKIKGMAMENVSLKLTALNGRLSVGPLSAHLYGGRSSAQAVYDVSGDKARSDLRLTVDGLGLGKLLSDAAGKPYVSGNTDLSLSASGQGENWKAIRRTLNGDAAISIANGALHSFQIVPNEARSQIKGAQQSVLNEASTRQEFREIAASFVIRNGLLSTDNLRYLSKYLQAKGHGDLNLSTNEMDVLAYISIPALPVLPVRAKGPITSPGYGLDMAEFTKELAKGLAKAPFSVLQGLGEGLGAILGGSPKAPTSP